MGIIRENYIKNHISLNDFYTKTIDKLVTLDLLKMTFVQDISKLTLGGSFSTNNSYLLEQNWIVFPYQYRYTVSPFALQLHRLYSVTQSYVNSFLGYVVLDTSNNVSRDEDNILDRIYIKQICPDFYHDDFLFS